MSMEYLRSLLSTPGQRQNMVDKAVALSPDANILDLEDGVPPAMKDAARAIVAEAIRRPRRAGAAARFVRVNADSELRDADLRAVVHPGLDGIVLPKVERSDDVRSVDALLSSLETEAGAPRGQVRLFISIETARGIRNVFEIADASPRNIALFIGGEDLARDLGLTVARGGAGDELLYARSAIVIAAASARLFAIDQVWTDIHDLDGLRRSAANGRELGFSGKFCIHPSQIDVVNEVFRPTAAELELARKVVAAFEQAQAAGLGVVMMGDQFVERPTVDRALRALRIHEAITGAERSAVRS